MIRIINHKNQAMINAQIQSDFEPEELLFLGMRTLAFGRRKEEQKRYYHTLPIEHTAIFPVSFREDGKEFVYKNASRIWLAQPLYNTMFQNDEVKADFSVDKIGEKKKVIILNCLDSCYGHCLDKLFNAQRHLEEHKDYGLILIIHPSMKSLVPEGVSEIWEVDISFVDINNRIQGFDAFIKTEMKRFSEVHLSKAKMYLDYSKIDISTFARCKPFSEEESTQKVIQLTLILREDRFWLKNIWIQYLYLASIKFGLKRYLNWVFVVVQNRNFRKVAKRLKQQTDKIVIKAVGLGKSGKLGGYVEDLRESKEDYLKNESCRDQIYAQSHIIIGVHGSHLLIPTALASSFISILPDYKIDGYSEDFIPRYKNIQKQVLLGRFLQANTKTRIVVHHVINMIKKLSHSN